MPEDVGPDLTDVTFDDLSGQTEVDVQARDNNFVKPFIEVSPGTTITFVNRGRNPHNVLPAVDGAFATIEADDLNPGDSQDLTFADPGDYPYYCSLHGTTTKGMVGVVRVIGA